MNKSCKIILTVVAASALAVSSFAAGSLISIKVDPSIKILVNGEEFKPKDANGNDVMTFTYNGTTYAPLRALAEAYGLEVGYDAAKKMATVGDKNADSSKVNASSENKQPESSVTLSSSYVSGNYKVGVDIPAGTYVLIPNSSKSKAYFSYSSDPNGRDIIENDNFAGNSIIQINTGEYLELSRCTAYPIESAPEIKPQNGILADGFYIVGIHIPAGEYKVITNSDSRGYYCLYNDIRRDDIESNDNFENSRYIFIEEGQYLLLNRCHLEIK